MAASVQPNSCIKTQHTDIQIQKPNSSTQELRYGPLAERFASLVRQGAIDESGKSKTFCPPLQLKTALPLPENYEQVQVLLKLGEAHLIGGAALHHIFSSEEELQALCSALEIDYDPTYVETRLPVDTDLRFLVPRLCADLYEGVLRPNKTVQTIFTPTQEFCVVPIGAVDWVFYSRLHPSYFFSPLYIDIPTRTLRSFEGGLAQPLLDHFLGRIPDPPHAKDLDYKGWLKLNSERTKGKYCSQDLAMTLLRSFEQTYGPDVGDWKDKHHPDSIEEQIAFDFNRGSPVTPHEGEGICRTLSRLGVSEEQKRAFLLLFAHHRPPEKMSIMEGMAILPLEGVYFQMPNDVEGALEILNGDLSPFEEVYSLLCRTQCANAPLQTRYHEKIADLFLTLLLPEEQIELLHSQGQHIKLMSTFAKWHSQESSPKQLDCVMQLWAQDLQLALQMLTVLKKTPKEFILQTEDPLRTFSNWLYSRPAVKEPLALIEQIWENDPPLAASFLHAIEKSRDYQLSPLQSLVAWLPGLEENPKRILRLKGVEIPEELEEQVSAAFAHQNNVSLYKHACQQGWICKNDLAFRDRAEKIVQLRKALRKRPGKVQGELFSLLQAHPLHEPGQKFAMALETTSLNREELSTLLDYVEHPTSLTLIVPLLCRHLNFAHTDHINKLFLLAEGQKRKVIADFCIQQKVVLDKSCQQAFIDLIPDESPRRYLEYARRCGYQLQGSKRYEELLIGQATTKDLNETLAIFKQLVKLTLHDEERFLHVAQEKLRSTKRSSSALKLAKLLFKWKPELKRTLGSLLLPHLRAADSSARVIQTLDVAQFSVGDLLSLLHIYPKDPRLLTRFCQIATTDQLIALLRSRPDLCTSCEESLLTSFRSAPQGRRREIAKLCKQAKYPLARHAEIAYREMVAALEDPLEQHRLLPKVYPLSGLCLPLQQHLMRRLSCEQARAQLVLEAKSVALFDAFLETCTDGAWIRPLADGLELEERHVPQVVEKLDMRPQEAYLWLLTSPFAQKFASQIEVYIRQAAVNLLEQDEIDACIDLMFHFPTIFGPDNSGICVSLFVKMSEKDASDYIAVYQRIETGNFFEDIALHQEAFEGMLLKCIIEKHEHLHILLQRGSEYEAIYQVPKTLPPLLHLCGRVLHSISGSLCTQQLQARLISMYILEHHSLFGVLEALMLVPTQPDEFWQELQEVFLQVMEHGNEEARLAIDELLKLYPTHLSVAFDLPRVLDYLATRQTPGTTHLASQMITKRIEKGETPDPRALRPMCEKILSQLDTFRTLDPLTHMGCASLISFFRKHTSKHGADEENTLVNSYLLLSWMHDTLMGEGGTLTVKLGNAQTIQISSHRDSLILLHKNLSLLFKAIWKGNMEPTPLLCSSMSRAIVSYAIRGELKSFSDFTSRAIVLFPVEQTLFFAEHLEEASQLEDVNSEKLQSMAQHIRKKYDEYMANRSQKSTKGRRKLAKLQKNRHLEG